MRMLAQAEAYIRRLQSGHACSWRLHQWQLQGKQRLLHVQLCSRYLACSMPQEPRQSVLDLQA